MQFEDGFRIFVYAPNYPLLFHTKHIAVLALFCFGLSLSSLAKPYDPAKYAHAGDTISELVYQLLIQGERQRAELHQIDSAIYYLEKGIGQAKVTDDYIGEMLCYAELAFAYKNNGRPRKATEAGFLSLNIATEHQHIRGMAVAEQSLGNSYIKEGKLDQAEQHHTEAAKLFGQLNDSVFVAWSYNGLGIVAKQRRDFDRAIEYYKKSLEIFKKYDKEEAVVANYFNLGNLYARMQQPDLALTCYEQFVAYHEEQGNKHYLAIAHANYGELYSGLNQYEKALGHYQQALAYGQAINNPVDIQYAYLGISNYYRFKGNADEALKYFDKYYHIKDSLTNDRFQKEVMALETRYKTVDQAREIESRDLKLKLQDEQIARSSNWIWGLWIAVAIVILTLVIGAYIFKMNRRMGLSLRKHQNEVLAKTVDLNKALKEKELLLKEIHHRVKNNLQIISSLLNLQTSSMTDKKAIAAMREGQKRIQAIALIHKKLYQNDNLEGIDFDQYIHELIDQQQIAIHQENRELSFNIEINEISLSLDTAVPLGLILSELISNADKHAFIGRNKGVVNVRLSAADGHERFELVVSDDGVGLPSDYDPETAESLGIEIVKSLSEQLDGILTFESKNGTTIRLEFSEL